MSKNYKHILFDLDRTLWDMEANTKITLKNIYDKYNLSSKIPSVEEFITIYSGYNKRLWAEYGAGNITKDKLRSTRFYLTLKHFKIKDGDLAITLDKEYVENAPLQTALIPFTTDLLTHLDKLGKKMYVITNGFTEVQTKKLANCKLTNHFQKVYTSDSVGCQKPDPEIFLYALREIGTTADECIMIGDDFNADVIGAANAGIDQVYFNSAKTEHDGNPTYEVNSLKEIIGIIN